MSQAQLRAVLGQVRKLVDERGTAGQSDRELLHTFAASNDQATFTALVRRHGPMVLNVCRHVLHHIEDAEDAFQATFLLLAEKAASLGKPESLAGWLNGAAFRMAWHARRAASRRRRYEGRVRPMPTESPESEVTWREVQQFVQTELQHLPEIYREAFVLCCLENRTTTEVAGLLGVKEPTVRSRLSKARKLLQKALGRRGIGLPVVLTIGALTAEKARAALSRKLIESTVNAATLIAAGEPLEADAISASVAALLKGAKATMSVSKVKTATMTVLLLTLAGTGVGLGAYKRAMLTAAEEVGHPTTLRQEAPGEVQTAVLRAGSLPTEAGVPAPDNKDMNAAEGAVRVRGRVLGPGGEGISGVGVHLVVNEGGPRVSPKAKSDEKGGFEFPLSRREIEQGGLLVAKDSSPDRAYSAAWCEVRRLGPDREVILRLVKDDVPVRGRVVDLQGRPLRGITVKVVWVGATTDGDLGRFIKAIRAKAKNPDVLEENNFHPRLADAGPLMPPAATTDTEGRFTLKGVGRDRLAVVRLDGDGIATQVIRFLTRPGAVLRTPLYLLNPRVGSLNYYGAEPELAAEPSRPVTGIVLDRDTGKPLPGAQVRCYDLPGKLGPSDWLRVSVEAIADAQGHYRLAGVPKGGDIDVVAFPAAVQPYLHSMERLADSPTFDPVELDLKLTRGVLITGRVMDKLTGKPVAAEVRYFFLGSNAPPDFRGNWGSRRTSADGSFRILGLPGPGVIGVSASNHYLAAHEVDDTPDLPQPAPLTVGAVPEAIFMPYYNALARINSKKGAEVRCDLALDPGREYKVKVLDTRGKPLAGVRAFNVGAFWSWSEPQMSAEITIRPFNPKRPRTILLVHPEKHLGAKLEIPPQATEPIHVRLVPTGTVRGRLVDGSGAPRPGHDFGVGWTIHKNPNTSVPYFPGNCKTDDQGRFRIENLVPGVQFELPGGPVIVKPEETRDLGDV